MTFATSFKRSVQPRKQRAYQQNAPLHLQQKLNHAHLSKELRQKHNKRSLGIRKGDKVKIVRGDYKGKTGPVEIVNRKDQTLIITGIDFVKKDGSKAFVPVAVSNVIITELAFDDKERKAIVERKTNGPKAP